MIRQFQNQDAIEKNEKHSKHFRLNYLLVNMNHLIPESKNYFVLHHVVKHKLDSDFFSIFKTKIHLLFVHFASFYSLIYIKRQIGNFGKTLHNFHRFH